jgi:hypothetical protein
MGRSERMMVDCVAPSMALCAGVGIGLDTKANYRTSPEPCRSQWNCTVALAGGKVLAGRLTSNIS